MERNRCSIREPSPTSLKVIFMCTKSPEYGLTRQPEKPRIPFHTFTIHQYIIHNITESLTIKYSMIVNTVLPHHIPHITHTLTHYHNERKNVHTVSNMQYIAAEPRSLFQRTSVQHLAEPICHNADSFHNLIFSLLAKLCFTLFFRLLFRIRDR